jgi:RNA polymerase sigma-70 factor (ECF subfamily)
VSLSDVRERSLHTFDERFTAVRPRLLSICLGLVGGGLAEDIVHDAYLRGRSKVHQLRDPALFDAWMARLAINLCFNAHRRGRRQRDAEFALAARASGSQQRDIALIELIEQLPPRERTLLVLHYGHGYPLADVARLAGTSHTNARTILFRARAKLGERLREADR